MLSFIWLYLGLAYAQKPQFEPAFPLNPSLPASINYAPSVTPTVNNPSAPSAGAICPGYTASHVQYSSTGMKADLTLSGQACNSYGFDIQDLCLEVSYQSQQRLNVRITPKYLAPQNQSLYILDPDIIPQPGVDEGYGGGGDLNFTWSNSPSFNFQIARVDSGEVLFDTSGSALVFEDQFLELTTKMVPDYNIYGLAESLHSFRIGDNSTRTFWSAYNLDNDNVIDANGHSTQPMYLETRYSTNGTSRSHGVYARNAHGQDWVMSDQKITYRTIGGSFDFYFISGDQPKEVISQYTKQIIGTPYLQPYWTLGFMQVRWGYQNVSALRDVVDLYREAGIQLEIIANDLDYLDLNRIFTLKPGQYDAEMFKPFLDELHANGQYYFPILDPNVYAPNPNNASDRYEVYERGIEAQAFIRDGSQNGDYYYGVLWPGISAYVDFLIPAGIKYWKDEIKRFYDIIPFDGFWLDVSDAVSFATGSLGPGSVYENPIHVPFALPGDPNSAVAVSFDYPEQFNVTNSTEAASASSALASQSSAYPTSATPTPTQPPSTPTAGVRQVIFPPYAINNNAVPGNALYKQALAPNATHGDGPYNSTEYQLHNLYGHLSAKATFAGLAETKPGKRPFVLSRSTFAGTGTFAGHWNGDTASTFGNMYFGITQALQFSIAGIAYTGQETCGFRGNSDYELCTRWMQLSSFWPLYRNHNSRNTIAQEAYRWSTTLEATKIVMDLRYSLLPYTYTLFYKANCLGETVLRALAWEFPNDTQLKAVETQFMSGPAILVTPVLAPLATTVQGVFPGVADGTKWFDMYTLDEVDVQPGENKTLDAPLLRLNVHVRSGYVIPMQKAGNTTKTSRQSPWSLLVTLDKTQCAEGELYMDDGVTLYPTDTKTVDFKYSNSILCATINGSYSDNLPLANVTLAGIDSCPTSVWVDYNGSKMDTRGVSINCKGKTAYVTGLEGATSRGAWSGGEVKIGFEH